MGHLAYFFQRKNTILFIQIASVLILVSTALTWVTATGLPDTAAADEISLSGAEMAPTIRAMGVVGVAGGVAATIAKGWLRGLIGAVVFGAGVLSFVAAVLALSNPAAAAAPALADYTGTTDPAAEYAVGFAVWMALLGSILLVITSLALLLFSPGWDDDTTSKKFSRGKPGAQNPDEIDMWDDLSDGEDPTK
ncbi:Trp biosynthesis-associated membrane protein [Nesterenkonia muleiensis]|uniref:Trp biosynthesis-associated membrane protein n=1 Tax=Nesterenkonia muleiensis TaxID=2282648 RepID=UPI000E70DDCD|nr:Trp biosynthesis-associated membrane protein [Nesterenkonia muleiensis]